MVCIDCAEDTVGYFRRAVAEDGEYDPCMLLEGPFCICCLVSFVDDCSECEGETVN